MWAKYRFFEKGIGTKEFKECQMRDIRDVLDVSSEINAKMIREQKVQDIISKQNYG